MFLLPNNIGNRNLCVNKEKPFPERQLRKGQSQAHGILTKRKTARERQLPSSKNRRPVHFTIGVVYPFMVAHLPRKGKVNLWQEKPRPVPVISEKRP